MILNDMNKTYVSFAFYKFLHLVPRRVETAWKLRNLAEKDKVKIQCSEGVWQAG